MEGMFTFVGIIIIVFGVLQIILFFKMWGMTNDVKQIKNGLPHAPNNIPLAKIENALGNVDKAKELIRRDFIIDLYDIYKNAVDAEWGKSNIVEDIYLKEYDKLKQLYAKRFANIEEYIDFSKYSTYAQARGIFD